MADVVRKCDTAQGERFSDALEAPLASLGASRADSPRKRLRTVWQTIVGTAVLVMLAAFLALVRYGSVGALRTAAAGCSLYLEERVFDLGEVRPYSESKVNVVLQNVSNKECQIVGSHWTWL